jgi:hypothetical protein
MSDDILVDAGPVVAVHRLALAVQVIDASSGAPIRDRLRVVRETVRAPTGAAGLVDHGGGRFVLTYLGDVSDEAVVRITDPTRRFVPRRLVMRLWPLDRVTQVDQRPPTGDLVPGRSRLLRPWMLPGSAAPLPRGTTGIRTRVMRGGRPVRWARLELFTAAGRIGWGHGDERGEVIVVASNRTAYPPLGAGTFQAAVRVHRPANPPPPNPDDPLADLVVQRIFRPVAPPVPTNLDNDRLRGIALPQGYVTAPDQVVTLASGRVEHVGDLTV